MKKILSTLSIVYPFLILGLLLLILFWQVFFKGYVFIDGDNFHLNIPLKYLLTDAIRHGFFPFWNPYILGGIPYAADLNLGTFNLLNILYLLFPVPRALTIQVIVELFLIGSFQYVFLRLFKFQKTIALFGSIIFMLSGTVFLFTSNNAILHPIVYIPLLFFFVKNYFQTKKILFLICLVIGQFLQIISGHPQMTYYTMLFISLYILFQTSFSPKKRLMVLSTYMVLPVLISAFQLIPFFEYIKQSTRPVDSMVYAQSGSLGISNILTIFFPTFFGTRALGNWWGSQITLFGYMGVASLIFFVCGFFYKKFENKAYFVSALTMSFLLSLGKVGLLFYVFYYLVPGWSSIRSPGAIFVITTFFASLFCAYGLQYFLENTKQVSAFKRQFFPIPLLILITSVLVLLITNIFVSWSHIFMSVFSYVPKLAQQILFYSPEKIQSMFNGIACNVFIFSLLLSVSLVFILFFSKRKKVLVIVFILLTSLDLLYVNHSFLQLAPYSFYDASYPQQIQKLQAQDYRIFSLPISISQDKRFLPGPEYFYKESTLNLAELTDDHVVAQNILGITGYTALIPKNYALYISGREDITGVDTNFITLSTLQALSVRYIVLLNRQNRLQVEEIPSAIPRARLQDSKQGNVVSLQKSDPNNVNISVVSQDKNTLILADNYFPGWKAYVNGKETTIGLYNNIFRKISIPAGKSTVLFTYDPLSWKIGAIISIVGLCILAVIPKLLFL